MSLPSPTPLIHWLACAAVGLAVGCSGGAGTQGLDPSIGPDTDFEVRSTSVVSGAMWRLNREILVEFTHDVDFSTVSSSTVQVVDSQGLPAIGTYSEAGPRTVRFQPRCPTNATYSDGGFAQGRSYRLHLPSESHGGLGGGVTVMDTAGRRLENGVSIDFSTPASSDELVLFVDLVAGPPRVVTMGAGDDFEGSPTDSPYSYVEFGSDPEAVEYFRFDPADQTSKIASLVPLNLYSDRERQFAVVLKFNQPVANVPSNIHPDLIRLEYYNDAQATWLRIPARTTLIENCSATGASVRVQPTGIVPQGASMRVTLREGFQDLTGDQVQSALTNFARFETTLANPDGQPGEEGDGSDEILERFTVAGGSPGSLEDTTVASPRPRADWGNSRSPGALSASFDFDGTGGPGGNFDLVVPTGQTVIVSTDSDVVSGGPGASTAVSQPVIGGRLDVRNLTIEDGGRLLFVGPNTASIFATGEVRVNGLLSVNGGNNFGVSTLATTNVPEEGASGQAGGGNGGAASMLRTQSTPRGEAGEGAFGVPGLGGGGGETSYAPSGPCEKENRRAAGGGGGRLGSAVRYDVDGSGMAPLAICQMLLGMDAEPGFPGSFEGLGAVSQVSSAAGGAVGSTPFLDASPNNDFYGSMVTANGTQVRGELNRVWAGAGGGGGGDAVTSSTFPLTPFLVSGDEKGSGGGGGAGGLLILSIGDIVLEPRGQITADGGHGGAGENWYYFDRIGGGSGGGSGGHIVLSSAASIIIRAESTAQSTGDFYRDAADFPIHERRPLSALGGQGGAGREERCGAGRNGPTNWRSDAIPEVAFEGRTDVPPNHTETLTPSFDWCNETPAGAACAGVTAAPEGTAFGAGGDGGPGIIQLHISDPDTQLVFGAAGSTGYVSSGIDVTRSMAPPPIGWRTPSSRPDSLTPFFSSRSESFSRWVPLGLARLNPDGTSSPIEFFFGGTAGDGVVPRDGAMAEELAPIVAYGALGVGPSATLASSIDTATATLRVPGARVSDAAGLYRRNANLMREFAVRLRNDAVPGDVREYAVVAGRYVAGDDEFRLTLDPIGARLDSDAGELSAMPGTLQFEIVPFYYRLLSGGVPDRYPTSTEIRILFDATIADPNSGEPSSDPESAYSQRMDVAAMDLQVKNGFAADIAALNGPVAAPNQTDPSQPVLESVDWDFVRFKVEFNLAVGVSTTDLDAPRPGLDFLRIPYRF
ncbi:hypothetical protein Poly30_54610 [Planctomycetes bacterium Poly30]|uniref:Uncharacterized protein n=1 Tax=Saltatorellus ferox TaxID=2528018 RepID=A0A518F0N2_9BACT|nr:hypothetical protein Poly30_54610 [Planctomycetes bacterium Poly30]